MEVPTLYETPQQPCTNRKEIISKLCSQDGGLAIICETIVTLFQFDRDARNRLGEPGQETETVDGAEPGEDWKPIYYGIPGIFAGNSRLVLCLFDLEAEDYMREFTISAASQYTPLGDHFSVIGVNENTYYGLSFADIAVADKVQAIISLVFPSIVQAGNETEDATIPAVKRMKISGDGESNPKGDDEWVVIEPSDVLELSGHQEFMESESVDSPGIFSHLGTKRKTSQDIPTPLIVSEPTDFKHISHVGLDSSVGELTRSMKGEYVSEPSQRSETSSEVAIPPPPPVAPPPPPYTLTGTLKPSNRLFPSLQDELAKGVVLKSTNGSLPGGGAPGDIAEELKRGITLRPVGTLGKHLPKPPPLINCSKLLFEINTFKRNALRHVETVTDFQEEDDPNALQSVLKSALEKMKGKLSMYDFSRVASVNNEGGESGFGDEIDGPLFV